MSGMPRAHNGARRKHEWLNKTVWGSGSQARLSQAHLMRTIESLHLLRKKSNEPLAPMEDVSFVVGPHKLLWKLCIGTSETCKKLKPSNHIQKRQWQAPKKAQERYLMLPDGALNWQTRNPASAQLSSWAGAAM
eukprot:1139197-Pelagomonas_calceolata.AAC.2